MLFAEGDVGAWASVGASIGTVIINAGFAAVVGWYLLTKGLPKMQHDFRESLNEQRKDFIAQLIQKRADYLAGEASRVVEFRGIVDSLNSHYEKELSRRDDSFREEAGLTNKALNDVRETLEEVRDALREFRGTRRRRPDGGPGGLGGGGP